MQLYILSVLSFAAAAFAAPQESGPVSDGPVMNCNIAGNGTYTYTCPTTIPQFPKCKVASELEGREGLRLSCSITGQDINGVSLWYKVSKTNEYISSTYLGACTKIMVPKCS